MFGGEKLNNVALKSWNGRWILTWYGATIWNDFKMFGVWCLVGDEINRAIKSQKMVP